VERRREGVDCAETLTAGVAISGSGLGRPFVAPEAGRGSRLGMMVSAKGIGGHQVEARW
jgi:hypothetical protein